MRPTLQYLTSVDNPVTGLWVLACTAGGGEIVALTVEAANNGARDGWLEGWPPAELPPAAERSGVQTMSAPPREVGCIHDSTRGDGLLDARCLLCGADGYWRHGYRHDRPHPGGKILFAMDGPATGYYGGTAADMAEFACELAGGALGIAMRANPNYVMPADEAGQMVREKLLERFGLDVSELPGYRGLRPEGLDQARQTRPEGE